MPLSFVGEEQYVQFGEDKSTRVAFRANRTSEGTTPRGSQWTKNPIPACGNAGGGSSALNGSHCGFLEGGTQFSSPVLNPTTGSPLEGFCESSATGYTKSECPFSIVDKVQLPAHLQPGEWVLGAILPSLLHAAPLPPLPVSEASTPLLLNPLRLCSLRIPIPLLVAVSAS
jgi:hypothetical protein